jgi:putative transposase
MTALLSAFQKLSRGDVELEGLLPSTVINAACKSASYQDRSRLYKASSTFYAFISQVLSPDRSCRQAIAGVAGHRAATSKSACSADTGGYCKARSRIPEEVNRTVFEQSGRRLEDSLPEDVGLWCGRRVHIVDGSTLQIADTPKNRAEYPLQKNLQVGCHYPVVRILAIFSLAVGTVLEAAIRPYQGKGTGETGMLRDSAPFFKEEDVVLGDRYFGGFWDIAWWKKNKKVDVVTRLPKSRRADFRRGRRLGPGDHLITWRRTARPEWLTKEQAADFPDEIELREVSVPVTAAGFRTRHIVVVTTLLDHVLFTAADLAALYRRRWQAELNLRSLKTHMGMEHLRTKTPAMVRKELYTYLTAYNLVRRVAYEAAQQHGLKPWQVSFKGTLQTTNEFLRRYHQCPDVVTWLSRWLECVATHIVGNRPDRIEPYQVKRRPKDHELMNEPRQEYKKRKLRNE